MISVPEWGHGMIPFVDLKTQYLGIKHEIAGCDRRRTRERPVHSR